MINVSLHCCTDVVNTQSAACHSHGADQAMPLTLLALHCTKKATGISLAYSVGMQIFCQIRFCERSLSSRQV